MTEASLSEVLQRCGFRHDFHHEFAIWQDINKYGWDAWDDLLSAQGREHDKSLRKSLSATGLTLTMLHDAYCLLMGEEDRNIVALFAQELVSTKDKALATLRAERGRLFLKVPSTAERKRRQQKARRTRARHERWERRLDTAFSKDEAVNYMFAIASSVPQFKTPRYLTVNVVIRGRFNIIRAGRLLTYQEPIP